MGRAFDIASMLVIVGGIMVLVRPGSQGPALADTIGNKFLGGLTVATGSGIPKGYTATSWK